MEDDLSNTQIMLIIGGVVLAILVLSVLAISYSGEVNLWDAANLLLMYFIGPVILIVLSWGITELVFRIPYLEKWRRNAPEDATHFGVILSFFFFAILLLLYGSLLGFYPLSLLFENWFYLLGACLVTAIVSYLWISFRRYIFSGIR